MQENAEPLAIARAYHQAWTSKQFEEAGRFLAEHLETEMPINDYANKAQFLEALHDFGQVVNDVSLLAALGSGSEAVLLYDMNVESIGELRIAEHFLVEDGLIRRIRHIHDTAALRAAGFDRNA
jgi:hypothetical protein